MSKRTQITNKLVEILNENLDGVTNTSNAHNNVHNKLVFWDEVNDYPYISVVAGGENRQYLPSNFKWGFLNITIRIYIEAEYTQEKLEEFLEDIEAVLDANNNLVYNQSGDTTELISILSIDTDQGLFAPVGVAEMVIQVQYDL